MSKLLTLGILQQVQNAGGEVGDYDGSVFGFYSTSFPYMTTYYQEEVVDGSGYITVQLSTPTGSGVIGKVYVNNIEKMVLDDSTGDVVTSEILLAANDVLKLWISGNYFTEVSYFIVRSRYEGEWWNGDVLASVSFYDPD